MMRRWLLSLFILLAIGIPKIFAATGIPAPTGHVNDFVGVLSATEKQTIEDSLVSYEKTSGTEIAVAIIRSLEGDTIEEKAVRLFEEWKIGKKDKDTGILFLAAIDERKMRIEVGYGLEPLLTDGEAGDIIRTAIAPEFKKNNYAGGITAGIGAIQQELSGTGMSEQKAASTSNDGVEMVIVIVVLVIVFGLQALFVYFCSFLARSKTIWLGGLVGGVFGMMIGLILGSWAAALFGGGALGGIGLILDHFLSKRYTTLKQAGKPTDWRSTGGGFWGGGGSGKSSGGFGGFGGGRSGGGGASGGW